MGRLPWLRVYCEARTDRKLHALTDAEHRVWFNLLLYAAEGEPRGVIDYSDPELVAVECASGETSLLESTVSRLIRLRVLEQEDGFLSFINFAERQYDKPSDMPDAVRERVRRHRERNADVTRGNA